jgi:predicted nicotinamide N-methyase
MEYENA